MRHCFRLPSYLLWVLAINLLSAQKPVDHARWLRYSQIMTAPPFDIRIHCDSMAIADSSGPYTKFTVFRDGSENDNFLQDGQKVFILKFSDTILLYDYSLQEGDTFYLQAMPFVIDSTAFRTMRDGNSYKHYYLHDPENRFDAVWIEGLGERTFGWNYLIYNTQDIGLDVRAICLDKQIILADSITLWRFDSSGFEIDNVLPDCDFLAYRRRANVNKISSSEIRIYPIPADKSIQLHLPSATSPIEIILTDASGKHVDQKEFQDEKAIEINTENLVNGVYHLKIIVANQVFCHTIMILHPQ